MNRRIEIVSDLLAFLDKLREEEFPYGLVLSYNYLVRNRTTLVTILGVELIESIIAYNTENSEEITTENIIQLTNYAKLVDPSGTFDRNRLTISDLRDYVKNKQKNKLSDIYIDDYEGKSRFDPIAKNSKNYEGEFYLHTSKEKSMHVNWKWIIVGLIFLGILILLVVLTIYYGVKHKNKKPDYDDDELRKIRAEQRELVNDLEAIMGKSGFERLPGDWEGLH